MDVLEALRAESGIVAVVGAGGKKTTLYTLAERAASDRSPASSRDGDGSDPDLRSTRRGSRRD